VDESEFVEIPHSEPMITITGAGSEGPSESLDDVSKGLSSILAARYCFCTNAGPRRRVLRLKRCKKAQSYRGPMLVLGPSWQKLILERSVEDILIY
jgi:hypothetical protein